MSKLNAPIALIIMDGWGVGDAQSTTNIRILKRMFCS